MTILDGGPLDSHQFAPGERTCLCGAASWEPAGDRIQFTITVDGQTIVGVYPLPAHDLFAGC
jgi:hypothetical protein